MPCFAKTGDTVHFTVLFNDAGAGAIADIAYDAAEPTTLIARDFAGTIANRTNSSAVNAHCFFCGWWCVALLRVE